MSGSDLAHRKEQARGGRTRCLDWLRKHGVS